jgi:hypothetical protein
MLALLAFVSFLVALILEVTHSAINFPFVTLGLALLALHFVYTVTIPWKRG